MTCDQPRFPLVIGVVNVLRIVIVSLALTRFGVDWTKGTSHDVVGLTVFGLSLLFLYTPLATLFPRVTME